MARQNLTKALALLLAVMMLIGLTACAKTPASSTTPTESKSEPTSSAEEKLYYNKTGYPICDTPILVKAASKQPSVSDKNHQWSGHADSTVIDQLAYYKDKLGIDVSLDTYINDDWTTQLTMMLTIKQLPDMIWDSNLTVADINKYGEDGFFVDMAKYMDLMPNFKAYCDEYTDLAKYITTDAGKIYTTVRYNNSNVENSLRYFLNKDWMDRLGAKIPTTIDEFYQLLIRFRDEDPNGNGKKDDIPFEYSTYTQGYSNKLLQNAFGIRTSQVVSNDQLPIHADDNGKVVLLDDNYKEMVRFLCRLYNEGLMDKDSFSIDFNQTKAKVNDNLVGAYGNSAPFLCYAGTNVNDDSSKAYGMISLASQYNGNKHIVVLNNAVTTNGKFMISADSRYPEACVRLLDFIYTEDGSVLGANGQEGVHWNWEENELLGIRNRQMVDPPANENWESKESWRNSKVVLNETLNIATARTPGNTNKTGHDAIYEFAKNDTKEHWDKVAEYAGWQALCLKSAADNNTEVIYGYPTMVYPDSVVDKRTQLTADLLNTMKEGHASLIIGSMEDFDAGWDKLVKDMEGAGMADLLKIEQDAYDNYTKK